jgi:hypothetical protein
VPVVKILTFYLPATNQELFVHNPYVPVVIQVYMFPFISFFLDYTNRKSLVLIVELAQRGLPFPL